MDQWFYLSTYLALKSAVPLKEKVKTQFKGHYYHVYCIKLVFSPRRELRF